MQPDIIALGEPLFEFSASEQGDLFRVEHFVAGWGGDTSNFAVAASRSGGRVGYLTRLGDDIFADSFLKLWNSEGIDTRHVTRDPSAFTAIYVITHEGMQHHFTYLRRGSAASAMQPAFLPRAYIQDAQLLHVSAITQAISNDARDTVDSAVRLARQAGRLVSYDPNFRARLWPLETARAVIHQTCRQVDLFFPSLDEARQLTGLTTPEQIARFYLELGPKIVALKLGAEGALLACDQGLQYFPAYTVSATDLAGAGDTFSGAFAAAYIRQQPLETCMRLANAAAALTTTGLGCVRPIPRRHQIEALLAGQSPPNTLGNGQKS
jgi:2-dehydro-3-deoxygluconokinase